MIRFIAVLSLGLFAGFTFFLAFVLSPAAELLNPKSYSELFLAFISMARWGPRTFHVILFVSIVAWMWQMRHQWKSVSFVMLSLTLGLIFQTFVLAVLGHYRVMNDLRFYLDTETIPPNWKELRTEWGWFMILHVATAVAAYLICLIPLLLTWRGYEADRHRTRGYKLGDKTLTEVELHLKLHSQSSEPSAKQDRTH